MFVAVLPFAVVVVTYGYICIMFRGNFLFSVRNKIRVRAISDTLKHLVINWVIQVGG